MTYLSSTRILGLALVLTALAQLACQRGAPPPQRIFLITIDTLRADHLSLYGYARETSPFLDSLGAKGVLFETAFSSCSHTAPSHASLFTALQPAQHRVLRNGEELDEAVVTLAQVFRERGYRTAGFTTVSFLKGLESGFDEFHSRKRFFPATAVLAQAQEWIRAQAPDEKLFAWIHLFDVHQWDQDKHIDREALRETQRGDLRGEELLDYLERHQGTEFGQHGREKILKAVNRYDGQILSTDRAIGAFFAALEEERLASDALWVVTSDHGEGLGNHDYMGHGKTLYTEQIRVPLLFYFADRRFAPRRATGLVRLVDVAPTLAEIAGASFNAQVIPPAGRSFLTLLQGGASAWDVRAAFAQRRPADEKRLASGWASGEVFALHSERYKVIAHSEGDPEFYGLERDPFELHNLIDDPPAESDRMLEGLLRRYAAMAAEGEEIGSGAINPEYVQELETLGYL